MSSSISPRTSGSQMSSSVGSLSTLYSLLVGDLKHVCLYSAYSESIDRSVVHLIK